METARSFVETNTGYGGAKFNALVEALQSRDSALLREAAERTVAWHKALCAKDDWKCDGCTECAQFTSVIVGMGAETPKKEQI